MGVSCPFYVVILTISRAIASLGICGGAGNTKRLYLYSCICLFADIDLAKYEEVLRRNGEFEEEKPVKRRSKVRPHVAQTLRTPIRIFDVLLKNGYDVLVNRHCLVCCRCAASQTTSSERKKQQEESQVVSLSTEM